MALYKLALSVRINFPLRFGLGLSILIGAKSTNKTHLLQVACWTSKMLSSLQLCATWPSAKRFQHQNDASLRLTTGPRMRCALTKQGQRFLTKLSTVDVKDPSAAKNLIRRFVQASPKSVALSTLSHLLSPDAIYTHLSYFALPLYARMSRASWFDWNAKLVAQVVAFLEKDGQYEESEKLVNEAITKLDSRERAVVLLYCNILEFHSKQNSEHGFDRAYSYLHPLLNDSSSLFVKRRAYESMISGLCTMGRPCDAEELVEEVRMKGLAPSAFEYRCMLYGYGRSGRFEDMLRILKQMEKQEFIIDTVCFNMVLSSYGAHNELIGMHSWLVKMRNSSIPFSVRTYNTVVNSCPTIMGMLREQNDIPLSIEKLIAGLEGDEALVLTELLGSSMVLQEIVTWGALEAKLDLHGLHLGSSYLIMLLWLEEMRQRWSIPTYAIPVEVVVVSGSGKHSHVRGESPVKSFVKKMMIQMTSPFRMDKKNNACFVAKGKAVRDWLCNSAENIEH